MFLLKRRETAGLQGSAGMRRILLPKRRAYRLSQSSIYTETYIVRRGIKSQSITSPYINNMGYLHELESV